MLSKEQYDFINGYRDVMELFQRSQICVVDINPLLDYLEKENLSGGLPITRGCAECSAGFLKWSYSMLKLYEKQNGST